MHLVQTGFLILWNVLYLPSKTDTFPHISHLTDELTCKTEFQRLENMKSFQWASKNFYSFVSRRIHIRLQGASNINSSFAWRSLLFIRSFSHIYILLLLRFFTCLRDDYNTFRTLNLNSNLYIVFHSLSFWISRKM